MDKKKFILVVNPHYGYTKVAIFNKKGKKVLEKHLDIEGKTIKVYDQKEERIRSVMNWLKEVKLPLGEIMAVVGRGGILRPTPGGTYKVTYKMLEDLRISYAGEHVSNLGGIIAHEISRKADIPSFIVDPMSVDEMMDVARISGIPYVDRKALSHALNIKYVAEMVSNKLGIEFKQSSFVVAHLGQDFSIVALKNGKIIDTNNFYDEGPFSIQRCGSIPPLKIIHMAYNDKKDFKSFLKEIFEESGLVQYYGTDNYKDIEKYITESNEHSLIVEAMNYNISKEIGAMCTALNLEVDQIILTGPLSKNENVISYIKKKVSFLGPVKVVPGEYQMEALAKGTLRVLSCEEEAKIYENEVSI
ncbi:butyrate kinase [Hathewaya histolytica]|uniref:Probable butyrate kinase n=1 Tax=Hathewaya histolytica TaxID=1498 RepID=A0A4U9QZW9_HATHI|nr:butyrate kinase [Hathewaya histolytica]VTQ83143.1 butyrate kinase [Hathewaya histolytica]